MDRKKLVFLDTETTGTGPDGRLCQVAYKFDGQEVSALFKPPVPIEIEAMAIAHITNKMVADKEPFIGSEMQKDLEQILAAGNILVAHNAKFDAEILQREGLETSKIIDTFKIAHHLDTEGKIPKYALQYLRYYFDLEVKNAPAHDALGDVRVTEKIFDHLFAEMAKTHGDEEKILRSMLEISAEPLLFKKFNFGKHNGRKISEVVAEDASYLAWLLDQKIMARERGEDNDENWIYTLDYYLNLK
ncbi:MAG TPA: exonuclease domain-containing protein [Patescibacteria group bacterium]